MINSETAERRNELASQASMTITETLAPGSLYGTFPPYATQRVPAGLAYMLHPASFGPGQRPRLPVSLEEAAHMGDRVESVVSDVEASTLTFKGRTSVREAVKLRALQLSKSAHRIDASLWEMHQFAHQHRSPEERDTFTTFQEERWNYLCTGTDRRYLQKDMSWLGQLAYFSYSPANEIMPDVVIPEGDDLPLGQSLNLATRLVLDQVHTTTEEQDEYNRADRDAVQNEVIATAQALGLLLIRTIDLHPSKLLKSSDYIYNTVANGALADVMRSTSRLLIKNLILCGLNFQSPIHWREGLQLTPNFRTYIANDLAGRHQTGDNPAEIGFERLPTADIGHALWHAFRAVDRTTPQELRLQAWLSKQSS
jgi:hypothetical protein